jgi:NTP pyrophosphatase (non-canonical NTP hydrolase)
VSATRPYVDAFADEMERKLNENRHKGDREGWATMSPAEALTYLIGEVSELSCALNMLERSPAPPDDPHREVCRCRVIREAADVANYAMMIADIAGGMQAVA